MRLKSFASFGVPPLLPLEGGRGEGLVGGEAPSVVPESEFQLQGLTHRPPSPLCDLSLSLPPRWLPGGSSLGFSGKLWGCWSWRSWERGRGDKTCSPDLTSAGLALGTGTQAWGARLRVRTRTLGLGSGTSAGAVLGEMDGNVSPHSPGPWPWATGN